MKTPINIELPDNKILRIMELNSGDLVFSVDERRKYKLTEEEEEDGYTANDRFKEIVIAIIPKNRRDIVAQFLNQQ